VAEEAEGRNDGMRLTEELEMRFTPDADSDVVGGGGREAEGEWER